jgi:hypothetical protein
MILICSCFLNTSLQPNLDTRRKQLDAWCSLVLDYCRLKKVCTFDVNDASKFPPFFNTKINRMFSPLPICIKIDLTFL